MRKALLLLFCTFMAAWLWLPDALAQPLDIVEVRAPEINCLFDADCTLSASDRSSSFPVPGSRDEGRLQSRTAPEGEPGTRGEGLFLYEYRIDLQPVGALTAAVCVDRLEIPFGPVESLDYNRDRRVEQVFVVTRGGLGSVGPSSAEIEDGVVTLRFSPPVCPGSRPGSGDSSFFVGMASTEAPRDVDATIGFNAGSDASLGVRAPGTGSGRGPRGPTGPVLCEAGSFTLPIDHSVPACRCFEDPGHRELHCALPHPDFVAVWRIPFPTPPREPFRVEWTIIPRTDAGADLEIGVPESNAFRVVESRERRSRDRSRTEARLWREREMSGDLLVDGAWLIAPSRPGRDFLRLEVEMGDRQEPLEISLPVTIEE